MHNLTPVLIAIAIATWTPAADSSVDYSEPVGSNEIKVMSYNVENLFDTTDDPSKLDETFLPLNHPKKKTECPKLSTTEYIRECFATDWNSQKLDLKIRQIQKVVLAQGIAPDLLGLVEVENSTVLQQLATTLGYTHSLISDSRDPRGIDVGLLYKTEKLRMISSQQVYGDSRLPRFTRPILKVQFVLKATGDILWVYVNHWPSQAAPTASRQAAQRTLETEIQKERQANANALVIAMGDFNVIEAEYSAIFNGFELFDVQREADKAKSPMQEQMPIGSHYYIPDHSWSRLDKFFVSRNWRQGSPPAVLPQTFRVLAPPFLLRPFKGEQIPRRYNFAATQEADAGFADHLPISMKLQITH